MEIAECINDASPAPIIDATVRIRKRVGQERWLSESNQYGDNADQLLADAKSATHSINSSDFGEYVAASAILHGMDGWTYLGNAVDCLLSGDAAGAVHAAYYAELRAGISFLSSRGISVLNFTHAYVDSSATFRHFGGGGTHKVVFKFLQHWSKQEGSADVLFRMLRVGGFSFDDWLTAAGFPNGNSSRSNLAEIWLKQWSIDLKAYRQDHTIRNIASYRPRRLIPVIGGVDFGERLKTLITFWRALEPQEGDRFPALDSYLLSNSLRKLHKAITLESDGEIEENGEHKLSYVNFVSQTLSELGLEEDDKLRSYLVNKETGPAATLVSLARQPPHKAPATALNICARAILLLRLASAATQEMLNGAGIRQSDLAFWWEGFGSEMGLWDGEADFDSMSDLWADIQYHLDDLDAWQAANSPTGSVKMGHDAAATGLWQIGRFSRVGLWGIGL